MKEKLRILVTNDDGINAIGLDILGKAAKSLAPVVELWTVAPQIQQSGVGQSITMNVPVYALDCSNKKTHLDEKRYAITGTPADCVILALNVLMKDTPPDFVFSGINKGVNIGNDVNMSGTLGAAYMSLHFGIPSIAVSMEVGSCTETRWDTAQNILPDILLNLIKNGWEKDYCPSINIPNLSADEISGIRWTQPIYDVDTPVDTKEVTDLRGEKSYFIHPAHHYKSRIYASTSDATAINQNAVSISLISHKRMHSTFAL